MKVTIKETGKVSFKQRIAETRAMYEKMLVRDLANFASEVQANIQLNGFDDTFKKTYQRPRPYMPFRGADRPNKKGAMLFKQKQIVSRTGKAKEVFSPISWLDRGGVVSGSNISTDFSLEVTNNKFSRPKAIFEISGFTALKIRRRIGIIRRGIKATRKDWSDFKKSVKSNMKEHVNLLSKMQQARKAKRVM